MSENDTISLKEYFNSRLLEQETQFNIKISALEKATTIAAAQMEKRLESQNEFRGQLKDQVLTFISKDEYNSSNKRTMDDIKQLREQSSTYINRGEHDILSNRIDNDIKQLREQSSTYINRGEHEVHVKKIDDDIRTLRESKALLEGKASQLSTNVATILAIIGIIISVIGLFHGIPGVPTIK